MNLVGGFFINLREKYMNCISKLCTDSKALMTLGFDLMTNMVVITTWSDIERFPPFKGATFELSMDDDEVRQFFESAAVGVKRIDILEQSRQVFDGYAQPPLYRGLDRGESKEVRTCLTCAHNIDEECAVVGTTCTTERRYHTVCDKDFSKWQAKPPKVGLFKRIKLYFFGE